MDKAKERAKKRYWLEPCNIDTQNRYHAYIEGYHQAEKDLELSWEDISKIISIDQQVCGTMGISNYTHNHQQAMKEVLKRFNKERKEK